MIPIQTRAYLLSIVLLSLAIPLRSFAQDDAEVNTVFSQANHYYKSERYSQAVDSYEQLVASKILSGHLFYNLGNAYVKMGAIGKAILNYERALQILPRDADLRSNLAYARSLVGSGSAKSGDKWLISKFAFLVNFFNLNELTVLISLVYIVLIAIVIVSAIVKKARRTCYYTMGVTGTILMFSILSFSLKLYRTEFHEKAVITSNAIEARFEPADDGTSHFTLREGMLIEVTEPQPEWSKIKRWDGKSGWLRNHTFERLSP